MVNNIEFHKENNTDNSNKNFKIQIENDEFDEDTKVNKDKIRVKRGAAIAGEIIKSLPICKYLTFSVCVRVCMKKYEQCKKGTK